MGTGITEKRSTSCNKGSEKCVIILVNSTLSHGNVNLSSDNDFELIQLACCEVCLRWLPALYSNYKQLAHR